MGLLLCVAVLRNTFADTPPKPSTTKEEGFKLVRDEIRTGKRIIYYVERTHDPSGDDFRDFVGQLILAFRDQGQLASVFFALWPNTEPDVVEIAPGEMVAKDLEAFIRRVATRLGSPGQSAFDVGLTIVAREADRVGAEVFVVAHQLKSGVPITIKEQLIPVAGRISLSLISFEDDAGALPEYEKRFSGQIFLLDGEQAVVSRGSVKLNRPSTKQIRKGDGGSSVGKK